LSLLLEEYKLLQDKIDKIGAFRFTIKGWAVTATVGALVAIASGKGFSPSASSFAIDVLLLFFFFFEREQVNLGWVFNNRVRQIEVQFDRRRRARGVRTTFSTPNIARSLFGAKRKKIDLVPKTFDNPRLEAFRIRFNHQARLARASHLSFYLILGLAVWCPKWLGFIPQANATPISIQNLIQSPPQVSLQPSVDSSGENGGRQTAKMPSPAKKPRDKSK
jgi:hypothetical protein